MIAIRRSEAVNRLPQPASAERGPDRALNGHELDRGDAAAIGEVQQLTLRASAQTASEVLLFDLA